MRNKFILLSIATIAFFGCKKDDSDPEPTSSKTTLIAQQSWKFNNAGIDPDKDGNINTDISGFINDCLKDNVVSFSSSNGTGSMDEGTNVCNSASQTTPFTWAFANNESNINISGNVIAGKGGQYKIIALSATQFSLSKDTTITGFGATTIVVNLKH
jgi:hypothetical protein